MDEDHYAINRAFWDERAPAHAGSADYAVQEIIADPTRLSDVIRFDLPRLGDVNGLRGIHLQCHIGTDTISLQRLGAAMTGLDFSAASIAIARRIATDAQADVAFVESDVYSAPVVVGDGFDFVFTESAHCVGCLTFSDGPEPLLISYARAAGCFCAKAIR
jgi:2-polyprenyl-3-methyl-5-hydroxy-6-metoxy-1,4-benzoquinol methylase